ncbi:MULTISPECIES: universal stress protein [unclassified Lentimonas]|uniref:universal stress protein n=1 Tax=unclassified Lentimonas TaxID=2630993 RepID=UPI00132427E4|nr:MULTISPECIES: universal stress protein [unclassified Lentimonas]CAA6689880.1 Universal stress protein family 4 [Lentimonas sp. CC10]CAA6697149.1 Universal stress protein family 4 [Lentimonas sp. CC19]CAA7069423.1 Universal stress protein family 4 [Lentimonas sp. CC11]
MPNILACTDGSIYAPSVYNHTAWAAAKMPASVHVLHMLNPHHENPVKADTSGSIGLGAKSALLKEIVELEATRAKLARKRGEAILEDATTQLTAAGVKEVVADQKHGRLSDSIDSYERDADLVVIGKRGNHADFAAGHIGHNLERVVRSCKHPVLVTSREFTKMESFVLAFDGGDSSKMAVEYAASHPLLKGMHCYLLYVGSGKAKIESALANAKNTLEAAGYEVTVEQRDGEPDKVIGDVVAQDHIDLLVMGAYGHSHIRHLIVGSTTTAMIRTVKIPVLLFR